jgi:hypothetical protein
MITTNVTITVPLLVPQGCRLGTETRMMTLYLDGTEPEWQG